MGLNMKRFAENYLLEWKDRKRRKPLIIRGARQTGKTYLVEKFAGTHFEKFVKVDFEFDVEAQSIFQSKDPALITNELALYFDIDIVVHRTLLFLDEIQYVPDLLPYIKSAIDRDRKPGWWLLSGSQHFSLMAGVSESLAGRAAILSLLPFSWNEF